MRLSIYFTLEEALHTNTGLMNIPDAIQLQHIKRSALCMDAVREFLGHAITPSSWFRCDAVNEKIGGVHGSAHTRGDAIDFTCPAFGTPYEICIALEKSGIKFDQLIQEGTWVHISFGARMRQQTLTKVAGGYKPGIARTV